MSADDLIERRRLRRKLTFWRAAALAIAALAIIAAVVLQRGGGGETGRESEHIAKVRIEGTVTEDEELLERLDEIAESEKVKGVVLSIDTPGGTTAGGEAIYNAVRKISEKKPVVAQVGTLAASAGYMIASATDHIVARQSSIVGSIGVIVQYPNISEMLSRLGIRFEDIKSSPLKAEPSPFNETTAAEKEMMARMVRDSYDWFVGLVAARRPLSRSEVLALADGSVFTGRQGLERKLIDELGGEEEAVAWLKGRDIGEDLEVIEWKKPRQTGLLSLAARSAFWGGDAEGLQTTVERFVEAIQNEPLFLDGLVSIWHPSDWGKNE